VADACMDTQIDIEPSYVRSTSRSHTKNLVSVTLSGSQWTESILQPLRPV